MELKERIEEIIAGAITESLTIEEASERILLLLNVSGMFSEEQIGQAYWDGREHEESGGGMFDIENYR